MEFYTITIKDKEHRCRLNARACVKVEKALGTNPLNVLARMANANEMPNLETLIVILNASLQAYEPGISIEKTYDLFDEYVEDGKTIVDLLKEIIEIFKVSGFFNEEQLNSKN